MEAPCEKAKVCVRDGGLVREPLFAGQGVGMSQEIDTANGAHIIARLTSRERATFPGAIAQLGERHNGIVEVAGSIPAGSTNIRSRYAGSCPNAASNKSTGLVG